MSEDSEDYSDRSISDEDESDEDSFMKFEELHQCALLTADSITDPFFPRTTQILLEYQLGRWVPRLREPRDLYGVSSSGELSPTRWPYHCEVIDEKVQHIDSTPPYSEPVYIPTGLETEPIYSNSKEDTVVYLAEDAYKEPCFVYSRVGGNRTALKQPVDDCDSTLMFEARFESGNLQKVVKVAEYEYQLTVRPDLFTNKHTQWYYFQVTNTQAEIAYRFTIINFTKPASLYNRGMRPLFYSEKEAKTNNIGWRRIGEQIKYYRNNPGQDGRHYFSLTWTFQFPHSNDTCYFAHCYPYTYTNLQEYLSSINNDPVRSKFCKIRVLCHTIARNMVYILTITTPLKNADSRKRKAVILTARVHPGETNSSWIMKGFLDFILGSSRDAQLLRDTFIFKVVPMLNPDGVIVGNYRCSLAGRDLNRNYTSLLKESFPSVWYTRNMIHRLMEKREVILYCDLHGHSRKENIFMYGCGGSAKGKALYLQQRIFPLMMSKNCPDKFSFSACKFNVQRSKEGTGRVVMWKMGIRNSFTMEATFCGSTLGNKRGTHFNTKDLESMGYHFCDSLLDYCDPDRSKYYQCLRELEEMQKHINLEKVLDDSDTSLKEITLESSSRGSDSSDSNESQSYILKLTSQIKPKKKHLRTKKERNSTLARHQNARQEREVCGRGYLMPGYKESNADVKDTRPTVSDDRVFDYFKRPLPNQGSGKMPGQTSSWLLKKYLSSQSMIQRFSKYQQRHFSETRKRPIQEAINPRSSGLNRNSFRVTSLKCTVSKPTSSWTEKPRIPTEDLHNNLKGKMRQSASFPNKKTGINWTDDEKSIYRDKKIAQTEEILQYLIPIMESTTNVRTNQIKRIFSPRNNFQIQNQMLNSAPYVHLKRYSASWAPSNTLPFIGQRNLLASSSERLQSVSQKSCESLSLFRGHKKRKACSAISAVKTKDMKPVVGKWETPPLGLEKGVTVTKGRSSQAVESNQQPSMRIAPPPTQPDSEQPAKNEGQPTFHLKVQRQK
ncbi:cytosolic carboxypeptidase 3 isoform X2 [Pipistrellus kuhlii]|uniref:ATP/GTP binding protein like 3 n=1 Tax=Pipistrellus kuhlii TaxID=59472 RepID=A0A7J7WK78_PIPKU|nr:cytosolic carboxypeptidase 3 isoform X2 [Pipistrellus kuhlii]KAF6337751.1 ATP/GTP binding protein like 3 [Pipistrellus kuhlii]